MTAHELRRQLLTNGYEPIPVAGKAPRWEGWNNDAITAARLAEIEATHPDHTNTGLRTGRLVGVDIDLTDAAHVIEIEKGIANALSESPLRRVGAKGALLCYRNDAPIPKITVGTKDKRLVEILGAGQHFVAYGTHPVTGKEYEWTQDWLGGDPLQTPLAELPNVTAKQLHDAAQAIAAKLATLGYGDVAVTGIKAEREATAPAASGAPVSPAQIEAMLRCIPPSIDRNAWLTVCGGLVNAPVTDAGWVGLDVFTHWSSGAMHDARPANYQGPEDCEAQWARDLGNSNAPAFGALVNLAREHGYKGPSQSAPVVRPVRERIAPHVLDRLIADSGTVRDERPNLFSTRQADRRRLPPAWLIESLIEENTDAVLVAPSKFLKSFLAVDLACHVATGKRWGKLAVAPPAPVFYCAAEGAHSVQAQRVTAWEVAHGDGAFSAERVHVASIAPTLNSDGVEEIIADAKAFLKPGEKAGLFVVDTMNRALNGADEDKSSTASAYFNMLAPIRAALGCSTLTLHHMGKDTQKGARGSSAFYAGFDTVIVIDKAAKDEATGTYFMTVRVDKQKDGEDGQVFYLHARKVETPNGASLALYPAAEDDLRRATGRQVGLRRVDVALALKAIGACPGGVNEWTGATGGMPTRQLATEIAKARLAADGDGLEPTAKEIDALVTILNRGAQDGGPFDAYVVRHKPRQWAIAPGRVLTGAHHA